MQNIFFKTDETGLELVEHGSIDFPIAYYDEWFSMFAHNEVSWHWHPEIEIVYVSEGATKLHILDHDLVLNKGDAVFVNGNIMHKLTKEGSKDCRILNFVLNPVFISGGVDSAIHRKYVAPLYNQQEFKFQVFRANVEWQQFAIKELLQAFKCWTESKGFEFKVRSHLSNFWNLLCHNVKFVHHVKNQSKYQNVDCMMKYIHTAYRENLTVSKIASSASISKTACYNLFKRYLNTSPMEYLNSFRLKEAAKKLQDEKEYITTIALDVGFQSHAYFSKKFKERYNLSPKEYRAYTKKKAIIN